MEEQLLRNLLSYFWVLEMEFFWINTGHNEVYLLNLGSDTIPYFIKIGSIV